MATRTIPEGRAFLLRAEGLDKARQGAAEALRVNWPYRYSRQSRVVVRANIETLRDVRALAS